MLRILRQDLRVVPGLESGQHKVTGRAHHPTRRAAHSRPVSWLPLKPLGPRKTQEDTTGNLPSPGGWRQCRRCTLEADWKCVAWMSSPKLPHSLGAATHITYPPSIQVPFSAVEMALSVSCAGL